MYFYAQLCPMTTLVWAGEKGKFRPEVTPQSSAETRLPDDSEERVCCRGAKPCILFIVILFLYILIDLLVAGILVWCCA